MYTRPYCALNHVAFIHKGDNAKYDDWIDNIYQGEVITIDMDTQDFIRNPEILDPIVARAAEIKACK